MRLWSLHPRYLDARGLVALWREALLARAVLGDKTKGYTRHPQLERFREAPRPLAAIEAYLAEVYTEACRRGYRFDASKVRTDVRCGKLPVTRGQMEFELGHLKRKLARRAPDAFTALCAVKRPSTHPLFRVVPGPREEWEKSVNNPGHPSTSAPASARPRASARPPGPVST
jgi:hypothetical protein